MIRLGLSRRWAGRPGAVERAARALAKRAAGSVPDYAYVIPDGARGAATCRYNNHGLLQWFAVVDGEILRKADGTGRLWRSQAAAAKAALAKLDVGETGGGT